MIMIISFYFKVGMLFDLIMKTPAIIFDWAIVLFQLLSMEVIPPTEYNTNRSCMFTDLTDMVVILMQTIQLNESIYQQSNQGTFEVQKFSSVVKKMRVSVNIYPSFVFLFSQLPCFC